MSLDLLLFSSPLRFPASKRIQPRAVFCAIALVLVCLTAQMLPAQTPTPVTVPTWRYDLTHAGQNTSETALTPSNVNVNSFGKLFKLPVDSSVYAQPLYVPNLKMSDGLVHNVVFVATENDTVYAFDADSNTGANANPLWTASMLSTSHGATSGATAVPYKDTGSPDVAPTVGITGTPAINTATNTMYLVANTKENGAYFSRLHAINILTGAEQANSPVNITATVPGTGAGSSGGQIAFSPLWQNQRTALNYYNGYVYFGYSAHGDLNAWHGWLFAYDATTLKQTAVLCLSPDDVGAGVWGSGAGMPIDTTVSGGRMFVVTGNGARSSAPPFTASTDYGESVIAFDLANGQLTPTDEFTPFNYATLNSHDWDQGSGGLLMLPDQSGSYPHLLVTAGKEGRITVLNRDKLNGYASGASSNTNAVQDITGVVPQAEGFWSTPAYWNGNVYVWAGGDDGGTPNAGMLFKMNGGVMDTTPASKTPFTSAFPGPTFSISSNGAQDGIAWAVKADQFNTNGPAVLYAFDANDLSTILYESDKNASRDSAGPANKFSVPVVTNGKVYVATHGEVDVYGLLNGDQTAAAPSISPNGGSFSTSQTVTMSTATSSAAIYYTLDGSTPTTASTEYTGPITISTNTTVKAIAAGSGYLQSSVSSATFTFTTGGGGTPINFANGFSSTSGLTLNGTAVAQNSRVFLTTNATWQAGSVFWNTPVNVQAFTSSFEFQIANGQANGFTFTIQNMGATALGGDSAGLAYQDIKKSVAVKFNFYNYESEGSDSTGVYTNGQPPVTPTVDISPSGIKLSNGDLIQATIGYDGSTLTLNLLDTVTGDKFSWSTSIDIPSTVGANTAYVGFTGGTGGLASNQEIVNWTYSTGSTSTTQAPQFSPGAGTYSSAQNVTLSDATSDAAIYYTTDGSTPSASSKAYSSPISVSSSMTIKAIAISPTTGSSPVASAAYVISSGSSGASFSLSGSSFTIGWRGGSIHVPITVTPSGGFKGKVPLTCSVSAPSGAVSIPACTVSSQPPTITSTSAQKGYVYVTTQSTTTKGNYTLIVKGTYGSLSATTDLAFTVN